MKPSLFAVLAAATLVFAQPPAPNPGPPNPGMKRTVVIQADVSVPNHEAIIAHVELAPGAFGGRHSHFGEEITYIIEGELDVAIDGKPVQHLKAGQGFIIPAGAIHNPHNTGTTPAKLAAVFYVEKGKPLATPAP